MISGEYVAAEARDFVVKQLIESRQYPELAKEKLMAVIERAVALDEAYMKEAGISIGEDQIQEEDTFYDDDDAYEYILDHIIEEEAFPDISEMKMAQLINDYMEIHEDYLEEKGLIAWDE